MSQSIENRLGSSAWVIPIGPQRGRRRLFCFPYAGASSAMFYGWTAAGARHFDLCAIELPGRGRRLADPPLTDMAQLVTQILGALAPAFCEPFALFGHSMGGYIAYELAHACKTALGVQPDKLIISASRPPGAQTSQRNSVPTEDADILKTLGDLGGTPPELLSNEMLMTVLLPALRADFALSQTYAPNVREKLSCPVTVLAGRDDEACSPVKLLAWRDTTIGSFQQYVMPGDHFFIRTHERDVVRMIDALLSAEVVARSSAHEIS